MSRVEAEADELSSPTHTRDPSLASTVSSEQWTESVRKDDGTDSCLRQPSPSAACRGVGASSARACGSERGGCGAAEARDHLRRLHRTDGSAPDVPGPQAASGAVSQE